MYYAPHTLQKRISPIIVNDEYGKPVESGTESWINVCRCRCDDNTTKEFKSENGLAYRPTYHIVCEGMHSLNAGDYVRCLRPDGSVRGEGKVYTLQVLNYLPYSEVWI